MKVFSVLLMITGLWAQSIQVFSPDPDAVVPGQDVLIAASLFGLENMNQADISLTIDGVDVTPSASIETDFLSYSPPEMPPGSHEIVITVGRTDGENPYTAVWSFQVPGEIIVEDVLKYSGNFTSGTQYENFDVQKLTVNRVGFNLRGSLFDWVKFKTNVKLTSDENELIQPRNRFGLKLSFGPYLDLSLGDANPRFSPFMVDGKRVRGLEANLKLGLINFHYIKGDINRDVQGGLGVGQAYTLSKLVQEEGDKIIHLSRKGYTFRQEIQGGRLSLGRGDKFQWGMSLMKVRDDVESVKADLGNAQVELEADTLGLNAGIYTYNDLIGMDGQNNYRVHLEEKSDWGGANPRDNIVVGSDLGISLDHKRIILNGEFAFSMLNRNIWDGSVSKAEMDTLLDDTLDNQLMGSLDLDLIPIDPGEIENWFILNQNITPLAPIDLTVFGDSSDVTLGEALLGMPSLAFRGLAKFNYFGNQLSLEYSQAGPEFNTLGNPYLLTNNREWSVSDRIRLLKNRLMLTVIYRHQDDDIATTVTNVTSQNILSTGITYIPGPALPTVNLNYRIIDRNNGISDLDTLIKGSTGEISYSDNRDNTETRNMTATLNYRLDALGLSHNLTGTFVNYEKSDLFNNRDLDSNFVDPGMSSQVLSFSAVTRYTIPLKTTMSFSSNASEFSIGPDERATQDFMVLNLVAEYVLFNRKVTAIGGVNYTSGSGKTELTRLGIKGGARIKVIENLNANLMVNLRKNTVGETSTSNLIASANLVYTF